MDYLRVLLVPFRPTILLMVGVFSLIITFFVSGAAFLGGVGFFALIVAFMLNTWILKYGFVFIERLADGNVEPPVMDSDMVSPFEQRPLVMGVLLIAGATLCWKVGGNAGIALAILQLIILPAQVAQLAMGDNVFQALNPLSWLRVIRGLGVFYLALLSMLLFTVGFTALLIFATAWVFFIVANFLLCEVAFFGLIGSCIWLRRRQLGYEPSRSPERTAAIAEAERVKERARTVDEVFQLVRIGKHVDATAPLAKWLRDTDVEHVSKDSIHIAEQALRWQSPLALNTIGSTLIRHLMRYGRPDSALAVFEILRAKSSTFTMDSVTDLRTLADFAESEGRQELAQSMRLETPVIHPSK